VEMGFSGASTVQNIGKQAAEAAQPIGHHDGAPTQTLEGMAMKSDTAAPCDAALKREILTACHKELVAAGFVAFRKDHVDWPLGGGFNAWVGLNTGLYRDRIEINPFVGVHSAPVDKLWTSLAAIKYNRSVATYAVHFGLILPNEKGFSFTRSTDVNAEAKRLAQIYVDQGLKYSRSISSLEELSKLIEQRIPRLGAYPERYASCLYLMKQEKQALSFVLEFAKANSTYFGRFAKAFEEFVTRQKG
jgi:hypothetical protein